MFKQTAKLWSHVYAGAPVSSLEYTFKIDKLCAMGFEKVRRIVFFFYFSLMQTSTDSDCRVVFLPECSNSGIVVEILGCGDGDRAAAQ